MAIILWIVMGVFALVGLFHLSNILAIKTAYTEWRYPKGFHFVTGVIEVAVVVLLYMPGTRPIGLTLGGLVCVAAIVTLAYHREFPKLGGPVLLLIGIGVLAHPYLA